MAVMIFSSPPSGTDGEERLLIAKAQDYADLKTTNTATTRSFCRVVGITGGSA
jgi:hypothetical protein